MDQNPPQEGQIDLHGEICYAKSQKACNENNNFEIVTPRKPETQEEAMTVLPERQWVLKTDTGQEAFGTDCVMPFGDKSGSEHMDYDQPSASRYPSQINAESITGVARGKETPFDRTTTGMKRNSFATPSTPLATVERQATVTALRQAQFSVQSQPKGEVVDSRANMASLDQRDLHHPAKTHYPGILLQPESRPITSDQLALKVRNIYSTLIAVEAKCISFDNEELANNYEYNETRDREKWQAMMALHRTLLYEHHDFLSASQHPSAPEPLRRLAVKYSMPARMWKHGIHAFLEILRRQLPASMDYMLQFVYSAYQMITLLYETVNAFKSTWIECLGDLARYRMAIEDGVQRDRETWGIVARSWYSSASDINPHVGRLYHHLGILARPNAVQQLCYYSRALTCVEPFTNARESLSTLLATSFESRKAGRDSPFVQDTDAILLYLHAVMFMEIINKSISEDIPEPFQTAKMNYIYKLEGQINSLGEKWKTHGVFVAIANITACFGYGSQKSFNSLTFAFASRTEGSMGMVTAQEEGPGGYVPSGSTVQAAGLDSRSGGSGSQDPLRAESLLFSVFNVALRRQKDCKMLPHVHVLLVFIKSVAAAASQTCPSLGMFLHLVPWIDLVGFLNSFITFEAMSKAVNNVGFTHNSKVAGEGDVSPLPEDYALRGEVWVQDYFSAGWFSNPPGEDTRELEQASTDKTRVQRVLWLGVCISKYVSFIQFDSRAMIFMANSKLCPPSPTTSPSDELRMTDPHKYLDYKDHIV